MFVGFWRVKEGANAAARLLGLARRGDEGACMKSFGLRGLLL